MPAPTQHPRCLHRLRVQRSFCRWVHLTCFWAWLISAEGIGPGLCAWFASLDPVHEVVVSAEANGPAHVILTHENEAEYLEPHGPWLDALLVIGQASSDLFKDHVLSFHALDDGRRPDLVHLEKPAFSRFEVPFFRLAVSTHPWTAPLLRGDRRPLLRQDHPRPRVMRC